MCSRGLKKYYLSASIFLGKEEERSLSEGKEGGRSKYVKDLKR